MEHNKVHAVVELVNKTGGVVDSADGVVNVVAKGLAASHAFRKYDWLAKAPIKNVSGNLRGMVVSADAKVVYDVTVKYGSKIERLNAFATVAIALAASAEEIYDIVRSKDSLAVKGAKLGTQATAVAMNVLTGVVTAPVHLVLMALQGYSEIYDVANRKPVGTSGQTLKAIDSIIDSAAKQVSDGNNIYTFVNMTINPKVSKVLAL